MRSGDRVRYKFDPKAKHYNPGLGTVSRVSKTRVMVLWDNPRFRRHGGGVKNYAETNLEVDIPLGADAVSSERSEADTASVGANHA